MSSDNSVLRKPQYTAHRRNVDAADNANLATFLTERANNVINADGFDTLHGFVEFSAGAGPPDVTLQILELAKYTNSAGAETQRLLARVSSIGPLVDGEVFEVPLPGGGQWLLHVTTLNGAGAILDIYIAAGKRSNEGSI